MYQIVAIALLAGHALAFPNDACSRISSKVKGGVYYPITLSGNYLTQIQHWMTSSTQKPSCVVEVENAEDVAAVLKIVGETKTPFAVKSGGHASNPGFSSTTGVHISLERLKSVDLATDRQSVTIGLGNLWSDVYSALGDSGLHVVGGRVTGPGTGGFSLGGGYSWLTDQYGLTSDTITSYELVKPTGEIVTVDSSTPDLNFALKGGLNRFGIVTKMTLKTFPQPPIVYGGIAIYGPDQIPTLIEATNTFQNTNTDPKAQVILTLNGGITGPSAILLTYYDGPSKPDSFLPFDKATPITNFQKSQTWLSFSRGTPAQLQGGNRGAFHTLMTTTLTKGFMDAVHNETKFYSSMALLRGATILSYDIEPFGKYGKHSVESAFPHERSPLPLNLYFGWSSVAPGQDEFWRGVMQQSIDHLTEVAKAEGIFSEEDYAYPNYALSSYTGSQLYGPENAARLRRIKAEVDPNGVMDLAGGFSLE